MRRLVGRTDSFRRSRLTIEELECRAQPAVLDFTISIHVVENPAPAHEAASANVALPTQANHHAQTEIVIHFGDSSTPPTNPGGSSSGSSGSTGSGGGGSSGTPASPGTPTASANTFGFTFVSSGFATPTPSSTFSSVLAREIASQLSAATSTITTNLASAALGLLLPPGQSANAAAPPTTTNPAFPPNAAAAQTFVSEGSRQFPGAASIPYLASEAPTAVTLFDADGPAAPFPANARPAAAPVKASQRLGRTIEVPADLITPPALLQVPVEEQDAAVADESVPLAVPVAAEESVSPWVWASVLGGAAVGTAWVVWQYWLKPAQIERAAQRSWRNYLLGLDFNRL